MLSNEQRAHDLALITLKYLLDTPPDISCLDGDVSDSPVEIKRDIFKMYVDLYNRTLTAMNKEFN